MSSRDEFETWWEGQGYDKKSSWKSVALRAWQEATKQSEAKCAALAAENAALKLKGRELLGEACSVYEKFNATVDHEVGNFADGQTLQEFDFLLSVGVPSTDAFLAEVRAQGVEMVIAYHRERADALHHVDRNNAIRHSMAALDASDVAAQLRQEAAQ